MRQDRRDLRRGEIHKRDGAEVRLQIAIPNLFVAVHCGRGLVHFAPREIVLLNKIGEALLARYNLAALARVHRLHEPIHKRLNVRF